MTIFKTLIAIAAATGLLTSTAHAGIVADQEQLMIDASAGFLGVGGDSEQKLAQTFTVGADGELVGLRLPIAGCGRGDLLLEIRELDGGRPEGRLLRAVTIPGDEVQVSYEGFQDFFFPMGLDVTAGDRLAFTVQTVGEDSYCSYATAPVGDLYPSGEGYFDSRPNPPGWVSWKEFPTDPQDLAFATLLDDPTVGSMSSGRCVIPGRLDPSTGLPLELPISRFVPACRCFEDAGAREFRCGVLHPDFFAIRRIPFPLTLGKPYEETWQFAPLAELDGPVKITLEGGGFEKPVQISFPVKQKFSAKSAVSAIAGTAGQTITVKAMAPEKSGMIPGVATFEYEMKDAGSPYQNSFGLDTTLEENMFGQ